MKKLKILAIISFIMVLTCGCSDNNHYKTLLFKHDSSRPQCRYSTDPGRVPYYSEPVVVATDWDDPVNFIYLDGEHALSPDSLQLFLTSTRPGGMGGADIWVSEKDAEVWSVPENLGAPVNSSDWDGQPGFAAGYPNTMSFVSRRDGPSSVYRSTFNGENWSEPEMVITGYVGEPSLVANGSIIYFVHVLVDDEGIFGSDIWYVRRTEHK